MTCSIRIEARTRSRSPNLDTDTPDAVDTNEEDLPRTRCEEFIDRAALSRPITIIVDDQDAAGQKPVVKGFQLRLGRLVPVGVEPEQGDRVRQVGGNAQCLLDLPGDEPHPLHWITRRFQVAADVVERGKTPVTG